MFQMTQGSVELVLCLREQQIELFVFTLQDQGHCRRFVRWETSTILPSGMSHRARIQLTPLTRNGR